MATEQEKASSVSDSPVYIAINMSKIANDGRSRMVSYIVIIWFSM